MNRGTAPSSRHLAGASAGRSAEIARGCAVDEPTHHKPSGDRDMQRFETASRNFHTLALAATLALASASAHAERPPITFDLVGSATRIADSVQLTPAAGGNGAAWRQKAIS